MAKRHDATTSQVHATPHQITEPTERPESDKTRALAIPDTSTSTAHPNVKIPGLREKPAPADRAEVDDTPREVFNTQLGTIYLGDSLTLLRRRRVVKPGTINLIMTSPPFGLVRKKDYGNVDADAYVKWFRQFARAFYSALADNGSLVIDIGGAWIPGQPTRSLYHYELLIMLCRQVGFHLAQEFYWWNPSKLPTPAEWVTVRRIRVKDAVNCVWWLSKTPWPKASNTRVLQPYSDSMHSLLRNGYTPKLRPSGHDISGKFSINNGASIPPNLLAVPNTESNSWYLRYCAEHDIKPHPARYPSTLPEFFIRMLTDPGDVVVDPFAGSCVTGEVAERLERRWICCELSEEYVKGGLGRFERRANESRQGEASESEPNVHRDTSKFAAQQLWPVESKYRQAGSDADGYYKLARPGLLWNGFEGERLPHDGGRTRRANAKAESSELENATDSAR